MWRRLCIIVLVLTSTSWATITYTASVTGNNGGGSSTVSTASRSWTAGSFIVIGIVITNSTASPICSLPSNSVSVYVEANQSASLRIHTAYVKNVTAVTSAISCSWSGTYKAAIVASEYAGLDTVDVVDSFVFASASGTGADPTCGTTPVTNVPNELVVGVVGVENNPTITAGAGFTLRATDQATSSPALGMEDSIVAAVGAQTAVFTITANPNVCITVTFKRATSSAPSSAGPNTTGTGADDATVGSRAWTNPTRIQVSDNSYATWVGNKTDVSVVSHYLKATNFGFAIPAGVTVTGIKVEFERFLTSFEVGLCDTPAASYEDSTVKLVLSGVISGNNHAGDNGWDDIERFDAYGGQNNLWGATITVSDVNASTSGVVISTLHSGCTDGTKSARYVGSVDSVRMTVYYTTGGGGANRPRRRPIISQTRTAHTIEMGN